jgi:NAD(P)-dependent dehydrogenase (short-subunit alcohol dehydrogenase family)
VASVLVARTPEEVTAVRNEILEAGGQAWAYPCDITDPEQVRTLKADVELELGPVSILVNNAGTAPSAKLEATTDDMWRSTFAVNVDGAFYLTRAFLPDMRESGGHVIAIASTAALQGFRYTTAYTASKHALLGFMRALKEEVPEAVKLSTICPGFVRTRILEESIANIVERTGKSADAAEQILASMNRDSKLIEPIDIAATVYRLIENERNLLSGLTYDAYGAILVEQ